MPRLHPHRPPAGASETSRAFTLTELLTAIAIIGMLAAILIPVTGRVRDSARSSQCVSNLRQLTQAALLYAQDNNGRLPPTYNSPAGNARAWWQYLYPDYCDGASVFKCPADETEFSGGATFIRDGRTLADGKVSYGIPGTGGTDGLKAADKRLASFTSPSRMCLFTDFEHADRRLSQSWFGNWPQYVNQMIFPHGGNQKANFAFLDGHIVLLTRAEVQAANTARSYNFGLFAQ